MASPPSSPDLHPPEYLQPSDSHCGDSIEMTDRSAVSKNQNSISNLHLPPAAITEFAYAPSKSTYDFQRNPLRQLENQTRRLTVELQDLLDAQSAGLMRTIAASNTKQSFMTGSGLNTLAASHSTLRSISRSRPQHWAPKQPTINLAKARMGIMTAMEELCNVKERESVLCGQYVQERKQLLATVSAHSSRAYRLTEELRKIDASHEATEAESLRAETAEVATEISQLRQRLVALVSKHTSMLATLKELDSIRESQAASYKLSLESLSHKTSKFLSEHAQASPERATQTWSLEADAYTERTKAAEREKDALNGGMLLWERALEVIRDFEGTVRQQLHDPSPESRDEASAYIRSELSKATTTLEDMLVTANHEGWKLLVAAIGTELQAFKEAGVFLTRNLGIVDKGKARDINDETDSQQQDGFLDSSTSGQPLHSTGKYLDYSPLDD